MPQLFIPSPVDGCLDHFQFLATRSKAAVNICAQIFVWMYVFISLRRGTPGPYTRHITY